MNTQNVMLSVGAFFLRLAILILVIVGLYRLGEYSFDYCYSIVSDTAVDKEPGRDVSVTLSSDMTVKDLAQLLERKGLIKDAKVFRIQLKLNDYEDELRLGNYVLNTSMTPKEMMAVMSQETGSEEEE